MEYFDFHFNNPDVFVTGSSFGNSEFRKEIHLQLKPGTMFNTFDKQLNALHQAVQEIEMLPEFREMNMIFKRYFISDAANQFLYLEEVIRMDACAVSVVQQPPLDGSKVNLWLYWVSGVQPVRHNGSGCFLDCGVYRHFWSTGLRAEKCCDTARETEEVFSAYITALRGLNMSLAVNCVRIWLYVQQVDINYAAMVNSRKDIFFRQGLNQHTHYIASTGIEGRHYDPRVTILADAYAVSGLEPGQITFLEAPEYLNPTHQYGVTFERGTAITYGDRRHLFISGTASIDNTGSIVAPNDINGQIARTLENIEALLKNGSATITDIAHMIVYLRDTGDYRFTRDFLNGHQAFSKIPACIVLAPVCRPGWLVEIECIAVSNPSENQFENY